MTGNYFRGDAEAVLHPAGEAKFKFVTYYEQSSGYTRLKQLALGYYFYSGDYVMLQVLSLVQTKDNHSYSQSQN